MLSTLREISYTKTIVSDAYHGTSSKSAKLILKSKQFKLSIGDSEFFGNGVYFYERDPSHCSYFGQKACRRDGSQEYVILQATVELGKCFDLLVQKYRDILEHTLNILSKAKQGNTSDGAAINYIADNVCKIDTVRGIRAVGELLDGSKNTRKVQRSMIVVRDTEKISDVNIFQRGSCYALRY